ncbi:MAG: TonB-dependent receptor [Bacteroidota bacterium]|nr:TonB-dependent receptor [Bacteroidota bacterium]
MKKYICTLLLTILGVCYAYAQTSITGIVKDDSGESLPGASVMIKGTTQGVVTDINGKFILKVPNPDKAILKVSYIGMKDLEVPINGRTSLDVVLTSNSKQMDEVVVVGYGTMKRKDLTGSVSSINSEVIKDLPVANIQQALAGRLAGVNVQTTDGSPDAAITIRVRGGSSITQNNEPLYIVDGFKVSTISNIAPRDIQSIDVLKDAASTAIYGAEGANGVVIITTKSAQKGNVVVNFNAFYGLKKPYNLPQALSPYEYVYYQREVDPDPKGSFANTYGLWDDVNIYKSIAGDNWINKLFDKPTAQQNYNLSISGGSDNVKVNLSLTHDDQGFIMKTSHYYRDNIVGKINWNISKDLSVDFTNRFAYTRILGPSVTSGSLLTNCLRYPSARSLNNLESVLLSDENNDITLEALGSLSNPVASILNDYKNQIQLQNTYNAGLSWKILPQLTYRGQGSYTFNRNKTDEIWTQNTGKATSNGGLPVADRTTVDGEAWSFQNTLALALNFNTKNRMDLIVGQEMTHTQDNQTVLESKFYPNSMTADQILAMWNYGTPNPIYTKISEPTRTSSYFGRLNFSLLDRYLITLTAREDGKNVFAPGNRWGFFPGGAVAWRVSEEPFYKNSSVLSNVVSNLKMRLSYGQVGNARVGSYWRQDWSFESQAASMYYPGGSASSALKTSTTFFNDKLRWESKTSRNLGFDFGLFKDRINGTVDIYNETNENLILLMALPYSSGSSNQYQNIGKTSNKGVEISLNANLINTSKFLLTGNFNISFNRNMIDKYIDNKTYQLTSSGAPYSVSPSDYVVGEGRPVGQMYGYVFDGVYSFDDFYYSKNDAKWILYKGKTSDQELFYGSGGNGYFGPGFLKLKDLDGDGVVTDLDKTVIGNAQPKHTGGFGLNARWKGFDLSALFNWSYGNDVYNVSKFSYNTYVGSKKNQNITSRFDLAHRFTTIDPQTGYNIMYGTYADPVKLKALNQNATLWNPLINYLAPISWEVEDGSFLRLQSLTLGYTLPENLSKRFMIRTLRMYASFYNLLCFTKYSGQDPEVSTGSGNTLTPGLDNSAYPKSRSMVLGVNVTF